jgi:phosphate transport system permease protein
MDKKVVVSTQTLVQESYGGNEEEKNPVENIDKQAVNEDKIHPPPEVPSATLLSNTWMPVSDNPRYGIWPLFLGTLKVTLIALLFAAPISILAAIYTAMFAKPRIRETIKPVIELLAGFPSVVIGFFALMVMASVFQNIFGYASRLNAFVGGIAMGLAAIPIIYTLTEDALTAIPKTFTEASLGLGASRRQTAFYVVLPAAVPGIFAAVVLGLGRIFGETMIALMATGNAAMISMNPFDSVRTLSATIGAEMAEVVFGDTHYNVLFLIGSLLFIFTFALNAVAEFYFKNLVIRRYQSKK